MIEKLDGLVKGNSATQMDLWEKAINENKYKNEERQGIMDRGQRTGKTDTENKSEKVEDYECKTCAARRYKDQSNDPSVSFQTPTHISPGQSAGAVMSHEMEHVRNEDAKAKREDREVIRSSVTLQYAVCPECGRAYVAGGETTTVTKAVDKEQDKQGPPEDGKGKIVDAKA